MTNLMYQNFTPLHSNFLHLRCIAVMESNTSNNHAQYASYKKTRKYFDFRSGWQNPVNEKRNQGAKTIEKQKLYKFYSSLNF